jgi:hypothetical protein
MITFRDSSKMGIQIEKPKRQIISSESRAIVEAMVNTDKSHTEEYY